VLRRKNLFSARTFFATVALFEFLAAFFLLFAAVGKNTHWAVVFEKIDFFRLLQLHNIKLHR
jgi:hypothetical protein